MNRRNNNQRNNNVRLLKRYAAIVTAIVGVFVLIFSVGVYAFLKPEEKAPVDYTKHLTKNNNSPQKTEPEEDKSETFLGSLLLPPKKTNFLILGTDEEKILSDVIMVGCFDRDDVSLKLMSIPRDLNTMVLQDIRDNVKEKTGRGIPSEVKLTELHSWSGPEMGPWAMKTQIEDLCGISIDYTVRINYSAFRKIVDLVGPITMEIPKGGLYYEDPDQNLVINVPEGLQELDGRLAEGVVRFRDTYARADLQRIDVQHEFMKEMVKQCLKKETLINNASGIAQTIFEYVETDFGLENLHRYLPYVYKFSADNMSAVTMPGEGRTVYRGESKISYFFCDYPEMQKVVEDIFYSGSQSETTP